MKRIVIIMTTLILVGCSYRVTPEAMDRAKNLCSNSGGANYVIRDDGYYDYYMARCKDGTVLYFRVTKT